MSNNLKLKKEVKFREEPFGGLLFDRTNRYMFELNNAGTFIIRQIIEEKEREEIIREMEVNFGLGKEKAKKDLEEFLELLKEKNLLENR